MALAASTLDTDTFEPKSFELSLFEILWREWRGGGGRPPSSARTSPLSIKQRFDREKIIFYIFTSDINKLNRYLSGRQRVERNGTSIVRK